MAGNRELSAAVPKTMGFRPDDIKSSGMAARTTWQAVATAAAGEVTDRSGLGGSSAGSFLVRQHIAGWGTGLVIIGGFFVEMDDEFVFTMVTPIDRNTFLVELLEVYYLRPV